MITSTSDKETSSFDLNIKVIGSNIHPRDDCVSYSQFSSVEW